MRNIVVYVCDGDGVGVHQTLCRCRHGILYDNIILIGRVVRGDFTFAEFSVGKAFAYNRAIGEHGWLFGTSGVALARSEQAGRVLCCHPLNTVGFHLLSFLMCGPPLNCGLWHPLATLGVGTEDSCFGKLQ